MGLRPISALVDLTNFLHHRPQPPGARLRCRQGEGRHLASGSARVGATFAALNGKEYTLDDAMTGIGDESGVISLAGVMGGEPTGCTMETTDVFIEIALFDPVRTAATGRTFNLESDARYRFERGVDPAFAGPGMELMTRLVIELCGGEASEVVVAGAEPAWRREIAFRPSRVKALGGVDCEPSESLGILTALGFACDGAGQRHGLGRATALARRHPRRGGPCRGGAAHRGLRPNPRGLPQPDGERAGAAGALAHAPQARRGAPLAHGARHVRGGDLVVHAAPARGAMFGDAPDALVLANPINAELDAMRPSILPNLIEACRRNADRGFADAALFETGPVYTGTAPEEQSTVVAGVRAAAAVPRNWHGPARSVDPFDAKADALRRAERRRRLSRQPPDQGGRPGVVPPRPGRHPRSRPQRAGHLRRASSWRSGRTRRRGADGGLRGDGGHPAQAQGEGDTRARPPLARPPITRQPSATLPSSSTARSPPRKWSAPTRNAEKALIKQVTVFDVYAGPGIEADKKSLAITVRLEARDRTLTDPEIDAAAAKIVANVAKITGGVLRG